MLLQMANPSSDLWPIFRRFFLAEEERKGSLDQSLTLRGRERSIYIYIYIFPMACIPPSKKQMAPYSALISQRYRINFVE